MSRYAFFISVAEYEDDAFPSYESVCNSGRDLHQLFDESELWTAHPPIEDPARPSDVTKEIAEALKRCRSGDAVLVYFVGHGEMPRCGDQHVDLELVMRSSSKAGRADFLPLHQLYDVVRDSPASQKMVLLDCCDSGRVASLGRVENNLLGIQQIEADEDSACVLTALRADELDQTAHARRDVGGTEYTAFSRTLIDLLKRGFEDGPEVLDLERVSKKLEDDLHRNGHPKSQLRQSVGYASQVPFLENRAVPRLDRDTRRQLTALSMPELVAEWDRPRTANGRVVAQFVDELLRDGERAGEFAHCLHGEHEFERDQRERVVNAVVPGSPDEAAATIGALTGAACPQCASLGIDVLHRVIRSGEAEITRLDRALGEAVPTSIRDDALARSARSPELVALTADLIHRPCGDTAGARAFELLHAFGELRADDEVRQLLVLLRDDIRPLEADTVLGGAVLGRAPEHIAAFVEQVRGIDAELGAAVEVRVARRRPPHVLAAYAATLNDPEQVWALLEAVTKYRSFNVLLRLAVALHGREMHDAGLHSVRLALTRERTGDAAATVLDVLAADGSGWRGDVVGEVRDFLCRSLPADELWRFFRRHRRTDLLGAVVKERQEHVEDLVVLYCAALGDDPRMAAQIASRLAERGRNSSVLMEFLRRGEEGGSGPAEVMFRALSTRSVEDTVGKVLISWETPANRPERMRKQDDALLALMAERASAVDLLNMAQLVTESAHQELARRLVHRALAAGPTRFTAGEFVDLLAWWSANSHGRGAHNIRKNGLEVLGKLSRAHQDENGHFRGESGTGAAEYFAGLVAGTCGHASISSTLSDEIERLLSELIAERGTPAIQRTYVAELNALGAAGAAKRFIQRREL